MQSQCVSGLWVGCFLVLYSVVVGKGWLGGCDVVGVDVIIGIIIFIGIVIIIGEWVDSSFGGHVKDSSWQYMKNAICNIIPPLPASCTTCREQLSPSPQVTQLHAGGKH